MVCQVFVVWGDEFGRSGYSPEPLRPSTPADGLQYICWRSTFSGTTSLFSQEIVHVLVISTYGQCLTSWTPTQNWRGLSQHGILAVWTSIRMRSKDESQFILRIPDTLQVNSTWGHLKALVLGRWPFVMARKTSRLPVCYTDWNCASNWSD